MFSPQIKIIYRNNIRSIFENQLRNFFPKFDWHLYFTVYKATLQSKTITEWNSQFWFNVLGAGQRAFKKMNVEGGKEAAKLLKRVSNEPPVAVHLLKVAESLKLFHLSQFL